MELDPILAVATKLAAPFDLPTMLAEVAEAAKRVLRAERSSVWLYDRDADEFVLRVASDIASVRIKAGAGLVGACARHREIINVPDCYADPRFDPSTDRRSGYRTRCLLTLPLVDHKGVLVGVMQVLNKNSGVFDAADEALGAVLAAQCAIALQRTLMTEQLLEGERLRRELEMARLVQMSTLPAAMPKLAGYDLFGTFIPADLTGGDTFDLALVEQGLLVVLGDATGHGIAPALSVTQMQAMLRMAFRIGADLDTAYLQVNNRLAEILPADRFITAFIGVLDPVTHALRFHSGGQAPILCFKAAAGACVGYKPTSFPLGAMPLERARPAAVIEMEPGDVLALISDGVYEYQDFGESRVREILAAQHRKPAAELAALLLQAVKTFAAGAPQQDDITVVLVKREAAASRDFKRNLSALEKIFAFTAAEVEAALRPAVDLALEELFTNVVKYGRPSDAAVRIEIGRIAGGVEVSLIETDADPFDAAQAPEADTNLSLERRQPGGLGLHLTRKVVDSIEYRYAAESRTGRTTFRKTRGSDDVHD
jgi:sigma-B regulation protein RsbU (phosphoserine phosphatase)